MHRTKLTMVALAAAVAVVFLAGPQAFAQTCGDPDGSGEINETDGINTLRAAADVSSPCQNTTCDTNNDGVIDDVDGVNVLRAAAGLSANLDCQSAEINEVVSEVETGEGEPPAELRVGAAPIPGGSAVDTIGEVEGATTVVPGSSNTLKVPYDATAQAEAAAAAAGVDAGELDLKMIIAINDTEQFLQGFFEIPLDDLIGEVTLTTFFPEGLEGGTFLFCPATLLDGVLSNYGVLEQMPAETESGPLSVSLNFNPPTVDVDLALVEPAPGERISFSNLMSSVTGGMLNLDSVCSNQVGSEQITYPTDSASPLDGQYVAQVTYFSTCSSQLPVEWTAVINTNGSSQTVTGRFEPDETGPSFTRDIPFVFMNQN